MKYISVIATWLVLMVGPEKKHWPRRRRPQNQAGHFKMLGPDTDPGQTSSLVTGPGGTMLTLMGVVLLSRCRGNTDWCRVRVN